MSHLNHAREFWGIARTFPAEKEKVYPDHAKAFCLEEHRDKEVLEYGCGGGSDTISLLKRGARVFFTDIVRDNVTHTWQRLERDHQDFLGRASPIWIDASVPIPLASSSLDVVTCNGVIHHIPEPEPVIREFHRLLRPGAFAFIMLYTEQLEAKCTPVMEGLMETHHIEREVAFGWVTDGTGCPYARSYTVAQALQFIEPIGFEVINVRPYNNDDFRVYQFGKVQA